MRLAEPFEDFLLLVLNTGHLFPDTHGYHYYLGPAPVHQLPRTSADQAGARRRDLPRAGGEPAEAEDPVGGGSRVSCRPKSVM